MGENVEWAKQLWDEWKYRHETFYRMLYRYAWVLVILAVLPSVAVNSPVTMEFFKEVRHGGFPRLIYWAFVVFLFIG